MKKIVIHFSALLALTLSFGLQAALIDAGSFSTTGDSFVASPFSGIFTEVYAFDVSSTNPLNMNFSGSHVGMAADDLLLTNTADGESYHLGNTFSETLSLGLGSYVFTVSGFALNALDPRVYSDYSIGIQAVPLPAAAWLFGSALIGFVSFSRRRKV
ncbi:MAG: VPLPA-CTERM sorting domain-containing protein [Candidatus Thiodiazotropha sp. (ex Lucinoma kastoroae)]|nr:VPLPA-CTERM sorting domain-containing protein [Candidatus Thiodiazotropha sp. (ex Rostrolucina anterorostrata)]MCU7848695.1 VPLPA-CTERM sorting domain-containing protein [Candidatus Thiodiazotropha sp. (ex Lucinoma kastoroae)]MCU7859475.1 VPLPA-CTERM sorting domain-containing protein [Candidatus Thiodiazotropha sp. (ex Lucinoma kastoroae)]